jgi:cell wall assembly regulator SMI1
MLVRESWETIRRFLSREFPSLTTSLLPGATSSEIDALEKQLTFKLPEDLRTSLMVHNGQTGDSGLFDVKSLLSCSDLLSEYRMATEIYNGIGPAHPSARPTTSRIETSVGWGKGWVPFAGFQTSFVVADCLPPDGQDFGQIFETDYQVPSEVLYESFSDWLAHYARAFSEGRFEVSVGVPIVHGH